MPLGWSSNAWKSASPALERGAGEACARQRGAAAHGAAQREPPEHRAFGEPVGKRGSEGAVEHDGREVGQPAVAQHGHGEDLAVALAALGGGSVQQSEIVFGERAQGLDQAGVDLRLGQRPVEGRHETGTEVEVVGRELEVEEGGLGLLVLTRRRQHVVRAPCGLAHRDVDDDDRVECREGFAELLAVGEGVGGVGGFDDHRAVAVGVVAQDLLGDDVAGHHAADDPGTDHRAELVGAAGCERHQRGGDVLGALLAEVAGEQPDQAVQVADQGGVPVHLHPEVFEAGDALAVRDHEGRAANQGLLDPGARAVVGDGHRRQRGAHGFDAVGVRVEEGAVEEVFVHEDGGHRGEQPGVAAGLDLQVDVGELGGLGAPGVDDDHRAVRIARDLLEGDPGAWDRVGEPRVLAEEHRDVAVLEVATGVGAEHAVTDPELAGLLLGEGVAAVTRAERAAGGAGVGAGQVIALSAATVVENRLSAVGIADVGQTLGHLADGRVPVDGLEGAVVAATEWRGEAVGAVLVEIELVGLLAGVAPGRRVLAIAPEAHQLAAVVPTELDLDAAVALTQDAGRLSPHAFGHRRSLRDRIGANLVSLCNHIWVRRRFQDENCSVARFLEVLGDWWTLLIIREAFLGTRRFADFEAELGISKNILSSRLAHLVAHGVLEKIDAGTHGKRFEYRLTAMGKDLITVLTAARQWGDRWLFGEGSEPVLLVDRRTGQPVPALRLRDEDGEPIRGRDLVLVPGPGAAPETIERYERLGWAESPARR